MFRCSLTVAFSPAPQGLRFRLAHELPLLGCSRTIGSGIIVNASGKASSDLMALSNLSDHKSSGPFVLVVAGPWDTHASPTARRLISSAS
jgi:hypothetical protein